MADSLIVENLVKRFGGMVAIGGVSFRLPEGHIIALLGPSGCGKTTTLRCIAGLERPTSGRILIGSRAVVDEGVYVPPEKRELGMVFQSYAIWPHLTVFDNIAFGLKLRKVVKSQIQDRVAQIIRTVGLAGLEARYAYELSGGQQQRVALARSLAFEPKILLFDEPLSNLDAKLRERMRHELREMLKRLGTTAVYVTHDQAEAMVIADEIVLMNEGLICQQGTATELYERPENRFVADFIGAANFIETATVVESRGAGGFRADVGGGESIAVEASGTPEVGAKVVLAIRPEKVRIAAAPVGAINEWPGEVLRQSYLGRDYEVVVKTRSMTLKALVPAPVPERVHASIAPGDIIRLHD